MTLNFIQRITLTHVKAELGPVRLQGAQLRGLKSGVLAHRIHRIESIQHDAV